MGISDRDYMQKSSGDERRIESYEDEARTQEYGDLASHRRRTMRKVAVLIVGVLALLALLGAVLHS
jgi:hypothetical protein